MPNPPVCKAAANRPAGADDRLYGKTRGQRCDLAGYANADGDNSHLLSSEQERSASDGGSTAGGAILIVHCPTVGGSGRTVVETPSESPKPADDPNLEGRLPVTSGGEQMRLVELWL
jgi:hypothetical protein